MLTPNSEFLKMRSRDDVLLQCKQCKQPFNKSKHEVQKTLKGHPTVACKFCSNTCKHASRICQVITSCANCNISLSIQQSDIKERNFCSHSCSAIYQNKHKTTGYRRSKIEMFIESAIKTKFPQLQCKYNDRSFGFELDFYLPQLKFALELNGIFHYEPIYGQTKLEKTNKTDQQKVAFCRSMGIELCVMNIANVKRWSPDKLAEYTKIVCDLIESILPRLQSN